MKPIINVQFMRAMAALAVLGYHFSLQFINAGGSADHWFYYVFNQIGYAGVDFFFVISGYIMWITTRKNRVNHPVLNFAYKRATRIYFGYWPYFLLALVIIFFYPGLISAQTNLLGSLFLTEMDTSKLLIQVAWTLQYELYFYVLFALLLCLPRAHALKAVLSLIFVVLIYQLYLLIPNSETVQTTKPRLINFFLSPFCLEFFAGCLLGRYFQAYRLKRLTIALLVGLGLLVVAIYLQQAVFAAPLIGPNYLHLRVAIFGTSAVLLLAVVIELELRGRVLLKRISTILGGASYSIYLSHTLAIALVYVWGWQAWILQHSQSPGFWVFILMMVTVVYSVMHYLWIEKPLMSMAKHIQQRLFGHKR